MLKNSFTSHFGLKNNTQFYDGMHQITPLSYDQRYMSIFEYRSALLFPSVNSISFQSYESHYSALYKAITFFLF